jgi:hypothetical protein
VDWINLTDHRAEKEPIFPLLAPIMVSFFAQNPRKNMRAGAQVTKPILVTGLPKLVTGLPKIGNRVTKKLRIF